MGIRMLGKTWIIAYQQPQIKCIIIKAAPWDDINFRFFLTFLSFQLRSVGYIALYKLNLQN